MNRPTEYNLVELYGLMFGYRAVSHLKIKPFAYAKQDTNREVKGTSAFDNQSEKFTDKFNPKDLTSWMGVPILMPVSLSYFINGTEIKLALPLEPIIQIKGGKTIIETKIDGQEGTFKEMFSLNDYELTIQGAVVNEDNYSEEYPQEAVRQIREACEARVPICVSNDLLSIFNIDQMVIYDWEFPTIPGENSIQGYELRCKSDRQFNLELA